MHAPSKLTDFHAGSHSVAEPLLVPLLTHDLGVKHVSNIELCVPFVAASGRSDFVLSDDTPATTFQLQLRTTMKFWREQEGADKFSMFKLRAASGASKWPICF